MSELLDSLNATLLAAGADDPTQPSHARAYSEWLHHRTVSGSPVLTALTGEASAASGGARQTAHAAVLGYACNLDASFAEAFEDALAWLTSRSYFVAGRPLQFEVDGLALLGVAVGLGRLPESKRADTLSWLQALLRQQQIAADDLDWNDHLIAGARRIAGVDPNAFIPGDLALALEGKQALTSDGSAREAAWTLIASLDALQDGMTRAATQRAALGLLLKSAAAIRLGSMTIEDASTLLGGLSRSLRRWTWELEPRTKNSLIARWDVENEYHVQDLLWAVLAPVFPDLDDEEWLKSIGHHTPRGDLAIPSLDLIIEVKFLRAGGAAVFSKVIQEVAADASTYLHDGSQFRHLIAVVWDDLARTEEHAELRRGLMKLPGVREAIIISRPSRMARAKPGP